MGDNLVAGLARWRVGRVATDRVESEQARQPGDYLGKGRAWGRFLRRGRETPGSVALWHSGTLTVQRQAAQGVRERPVRGPAWHSGPFTATERFTHFTAYPSL